MIAPGATRLKPDMTANIRIAHRRIARRWCCPTQAIQRDGPDRFVFVEEGGKPVRRDVTVGSRQGGQTEVRRGLSPTDRVL